MLKLCFFRGCRIIFMLVVIALVSVIVTFSISPDINFLEKVIETKIKKDLRAEQVDVSMVTMYWDGGPIVDVGSVNIQAEALSVQNSHVIFTYPLSHVFQATLAPELKIMGGLIRLDLDVDSQGERKPSDVVTRLDDVQLTWVLKQEVQTFEHVDALIGNGGEEVSFKTKGIDFYVAMRSDFKPKIVRLKVDDFSGFPKSWQKYAVGLKTLSFHAKFQSEEAWSWNMNLNGEKGIFQVDDIHLKVPFDTLAAEGTLQLSDATIPELVSFQTDKLVWKDGDNFGDFKLQWSDDVLHLDVFDGSATMPMLWSWLWMLGGDPWHKWLLSMKQGRLSNAKGTLDLAWAKPLQQRPLHRDLVNMKYHVTTHAHDADIALGLQGDYLYHLDADVEVDDSHLEAVIKSADLNGGVGRIAGDYQITWHTLMMNIEAKGVVDVGKLQHWLSPESAQALSWTSAPSVATASMRWNATKAFPETTVVHLKPTSEGWVLSPKGIPLQVNGGSAVWDYNRGLDLTGLHVKTKWFDGDLSMFINKDKGWALDNLKLEGASELATLTDVFSLPIVQPQGETLLSLTYDKQEWSGSFDFTENDWQSFAGFEKASKKALKVNFSGKSSASRLLPVRIRHIHSKHQGFQFNGDIRIDAKKLDMRFTKVNTAAFRGDIRVLLPFNHSLAWGVEAEAAYVNKRLFSTYLGNTDAILSPQGHQRPWSITLDTQEFVWEGYAAQDMHLQYLSDKQSSGSFKARSVASGDAVFSDVKSTFTLLEKGELDLHHFEADGSGQHIVISGSVKPEKEGVIAWQGIVFMKGKFGTLMKQAELDKLFKEGDMSSVFLGKGKYKQGEPWWRELKGNLRLRVDDGRMLEGGTLTHLLAAISLVDLPKYLILQRGDVVGEGLLYDKLQIEADFNSNILGVKQLDFKSSALDAKGLGQVDLESGDLDVLLIARPWQNIEAVIGSVPLLGTVLAGEDKSILRKVYRIHGPASDAAVDEVDPEDVGLPKAGYLENLLSPSKWFKSKKKSKDSVENK